MDGWGVLEQAGELTRRGQAFALATVVWRQGPSSGQQGSRAIITAEGELRGWIGGACAEPVVIREAQQVIAEGQARLLLLGTPEQFGGAVPEGMTVVPIACQSEGALEVYIEPVLPAPHLVVVGRSPMAHTLADLARALGWRAALIDGPDFTAARAERALDGRGGHPGSLRRGGGRAGGRGPARLPRPGGLASAGARRCSATSPSAACPPTSSTGSACPPGWTSAGPRTRRSPSPSWPSWSSCARPAPSAAEPPPKPWGPGIRPRAPRREGPGGAASGAGGRPGVRDDGNGGSLRPARCHRDGVTYYFCSGGCRRAFEQDRAANTLPPT